MWISKPSDTRPPEQYVRSSLASVLGRCQTEAVFLPLFSAGGNGSEARGEVKSKLAMISRAYNRHDLFCPFVRQVHLLDLALRSMFRMQSFLGTIMSQKGHNDFIKSECVDGQ
jgi:hypothetical protein